MEALVGGPLQEEQQTPLGRLIRLELVVIKLRPGMSLEVEQPRLYKHSYVEAWTRQRAAALLPKSPRLILSKLPVDLRNSILLPMMIPNFYHQVFVSLKTIL